MLSGMLYELAQHGNFLTTWLALNVITFVMMMAMSGTLFYLYYWRPTFATWQRKSNPNYPKPAMVRREVLQMLKGMFTATLCPALALHLVNVGWSKAYGGLGGHSVAYLVLTFFIIWIGSDFYEFFYHRIGHSFSFWWKHHKSHHVFFNPSPFAVIADEHIDQFIRSAPLLFIPLLIPVNMDVLFLTYGAFFYAYGVYLHWGFESRWPTAHHPWMNTAFQHYIHHAKSTLNKPMHTGFFFKLWDQLFGSVYQAGPAECLCAGCCIARGERTEAAFDRIEKPDYSVLLSPTYWWRGEQRKLGNANAEPISETPAA